MKKNQIPYQITVAWSQADESFEARVPALKGCIAYGETPEAAVKEVKIAARLWIDAVKANGFSPPAPDAGLAQLATMAPLLNLSAVARAAGLSVQTLASKLQRGTPLTKDESKKVGGALSAHGLAV